MIGRRSLLSEVHAFNFWIDLFPSNFEIQKANNIPKEDILSSIIGLS